MTGFPRAGRTWRASFVSALALSAFLCTTASAGPYEDARAAFGKKDYIVAARLATEAAAKGNPRAQTLLGLMYEFGLGMPADLHQAAQWLSLAADNGDAEGQAVLGEMYEQGNGVGRDYGQALKYYTLAAKQDNAFAQYKIGSFYFSGAGSVVTQDYARALSWYQLAAKNGEGQAQFQLGYMYFYGKGVTRNFETAVSYLKQGADQDQPDALSLLGYAYDAGYGVSQDYAQAVRYYTRGAEKGVPNALALLGEKYSNGQGVTQDWSKAYMLLSLAASRREGEAQQALVKERDIAQGHLNADQIAKAQADATACADSNFAHCSISGKSEASRDPAKAFPGGTPVPIARAELRHRDAKGMEMAASGTGFYVSATGHLITNAHVVRDCREMRSYAVTFKVLASDPELDLALLQAPKPSKTFAHLRGGKGARLGESVLAVGFPLYGLLGNDPVITNGVISGKTGLLNDSRRIQISAPVQPGNSGGPLLGEDGTVVGVVNAVLNDKDGDLTGGPAPQNVNFAVSLPTLQSFLKAHKVPYAIEAVAGARKESSDISEMAAGYTVLLECWK
ncbi:MAG: tetratricopeptide repeat-containing serine protease family protein [Rhizomicrobium sp.]